MDRKFWQFPSLVMTSTNYPAIYTVRTGCFRNNLPYFGRTVPRLHAIHITKTGNVRIILTLTHVSVITVAVEKQ